MRVRGSAVSEKANDSSLMAKRKEKKKPLGAAAKERARADPRARLGPGKKKFILFREEALGG